MKSPLGPLPQTSTAPGQARVGVHPAPGDPPHSRPELLNALAGARPSMDVFAMSLKLSMHKYQVVRGIELALVNHQQDMTNKVIASMARK